MTYVLGVTGGIATGKSTVSNIFKKLGIPVIDADLVSRQVVEPEAVGLSQLVDYFGEKILNSHGHLDRQTLADIIFDDSEQRQALNDILHPLIREEILKQKEDYIKRNEPLLVLDIPLLFEADYNHECNGIMVVSVSQSNQLKRLKDRNRLSHDQAASRIQAQMPLEEKIAMADFVIDNNGTIAQTQYQVENWLAQRPYQ